MWGGGGVCACVGRGVCACGEGRCVPVWGGGGVCLWGGGDAIVQRALHQFVNSSCCRPEEHLVSVFGLTYSYNGMELMAS